MNARGRYAAVSFLTWFPTGLWIPVSILLMLDRGLSLPTIAAIGTVYGICVATLELPTGGLADVLGRRPILIAAALASLLSLVLTGIATTALLFLMGAVLRGIGRALGTGPAEAWYVDTVHATEGPDAELGPGLARVSVAASIGLTVGTLVGGFLPLLLVGLVAVPLAVPVLIAAGVEGVRLVVTMVALPEPRHVRPRLGAVLKGVPDNIVEGFRIGRRDGFIIRLLLLWGSMGVALATVELLTPAWFATVTGTFESASIAYAVVAALGFAASSAGSALSMRIVALAGGPRQATLTGFLVTALALGGLAVTTLFGGLAAVIAAGVAYLVIFVGLGAATPQMSTLLHERISAKQRATMISMQSLSMQICGAVGVLAFAWVAAQAGPGWAFVLSGAVIVGAGLLMRAKQSAAVPALAPSLD